VQHLRLPDDMPGIRVDAGVREGDAVSIHYDPMIAKIIAAGADRAEAIARLRMALAKTEVAGIPTNLAFLQSILRHPDFAVGEIDTGFIERHRAELRPDETIPLRAVALASLAWLRMIERQAAASAAPSDPHSPWALLRGWALNLPTYTDLVLRSGERDIAVKAQHRGTGFLLEISSETISANGILEPDGSITAAIDGVTCKGRVIEQDSALTVFLDGLSHHLTIFDSRRPAKYAAAAGDRIVAPMPGALSRLAVAAGDRVAKGAVLAIVEAMKMEHAVKAPRDGVVKALHFAAGDLVPEGAELLTLEETR
jgi:3-methylcrotonyl-CoA carboxylase alpha subunit